MKIALIGLKESCTNKDKAGTFGNASHGEGFFSKVYALLKRTKVNVPIVHFGYMAAILRQAGHEVNFYESTPKDEEIVIIASSIVGYEKELQFVRQIRKEGRKIGFINAFATARPEIFLEEADFVITGEPEAATLEFAKGNLNLRGIIESPLIHDLNSLPFPDWDGFGVENYGYFPVLKKTPTLSILTSRGCVWDCDYCPYMVTQTENWRKRSPENVVAEIEYLITKYKVRSLVFRDIMYTQSKKRTVEISREIIKRNLKVEWSCETRADCLDEATLAIMKESGLKAIHLGIESPADYVVQLSGRQPIKTSQQERIVRFAEKLGIRVVAFYIFGFDHDTESTMQRTLDYSKHFNTELAQFDVMTPYPGTKYFKKNQEKIKSFDWKRYTTQDAVMELENITRGKVMEFKNRAYKEYYLRPSWMLKNIPKLLFS